MGTIDYEALIEKRKWTGDEIEQRKRASKLADIARNLESLRDLAEAEAEPGAPPAEPGAPPADPEPGKT